VIVGNDYQFKSLATRILQLRTTSLKGVQSKDCSRCFLGLFHRLGKGLRHSSSELKALVTSLAAKAASKILETSFHQTRLPSADLEQALVQLSKDIVKEEEIAKYLAQGADTSPFVLTKYL